MTKSKRTETNLWTLAGTLISCLLLSNLGLMPATVSAALPGDDCATLRPTAEQLAPFQPVFIEQKRAAFYDSIL